MKHARITRSLGPVLLAATTAMAQEDRASAEDLARLANTVAEAPRLHIDQPIPEGCTLIDDVLVPLAALGEAGGFTVELWPGGVVPYTFDTNMTDADIDTVTAAMADWESDTGVDFQPMTDPLEPWIHVRNSDEDDEPKCSSFVGVSVSSGPQLINYTTGCINNFHKVHHELGHALGFYHEHNRPDRDTYIWIDWDNIEGGSTCSSGKENACAFEIESGAYVYGSYDFGSVMHYNQFAFSDGTGTTVNVKMPWDTEWQSKIGYASELSYWDETVMGCLYPQADWRFDNPDSIAWVFGTFFLPWNKTFIDAVDDTPDGGTIFFLEGEGFDWSGSIVKAITIEAPKGGLVVN